MVCKLMRFIGMHSSTVYAMSWVFVESLLRQVLHGREKERVCHGRAVQQLAGVLC